jgi:predicted enzyme related to lactoylglutathione lyase
MAGDSAREFDFYSGLFGWEKTGVHNMGGDMGGYILWTDGRDGDAGGMMTKPPFLPVTMWNYYFRVDGVDAAAERIKAAGGAVTNGPMEVPNGEWIVQATDPQGAAFNLVSARR